MDIRPFELLFNGFWILLECMEIGYQIQKDIKCVQNNKYLIKFWMIQSVRDSKAWQEAEDQGFP